MNTTVVAVAIALLISRSTIVVDGSYANEDTLSSSEDEYCEMSEKMESASITQSSRAGVEYLVSNAQAAIERTVERAQEGGSLVSVDHTSKRPVNRGEKREPELKIKNITVEKQPDGENKKENKAAESLVEALKQTLEREKETLIQMEHNLVKVKERLSEFNRQRAIEGTFLTYRRNMNRRNTKMVNMRMQHRGRR